MKNTIVLAVLAINIALASILILGGCTMKPESVVPAYVSHVTYMNWHCNQLAEEQTRLVSALSSASDAQRQARSSDTVDVILLGLPVASFSGSHHASNIARLKGELEALQKSAIQKECGTELVSISEVVKNKKKK